MESVMQQRTFKPRPWRIVVCIIRRTTAGRALEAIAAGLVGSATSKEDGVSLLGQYLDISGAVLDNVDNHCFGLVALLDVNTGEVARTVPLMGQRCKEVKEEYAECFAGRISPSAVLSGRTVDYVGNLNDEAA
jgi:hypothetical protein